MPKDILWGPDEILLQSDNLNATITNYGEVINQVVYFGVLGYLGRAGVCR